MKTFLIIFSFAIFAVSISSCRERFRRQLWGPPPKPDLLWGGHSPEYHRNDDFFDDSDQSWNRPQGFNRPFQPQNNFQNGWGGSRGDNFNNGFDSYDNGFDDYDTGSRPNNQKNRQTNENDRRQNQNKKGQNQSQNQNQNQNRRTTSTTTENLGPITTTPRTIHVAPKGCQCPMTQQFNPVCGTDGNTYRNEGLLNCYVRCGTNVSRKRLGTC